MKALNGDQIGGMAKGLFQALLGFDAFRGPHRPVQLEGAAARTGRVATANAESARQTAFFPFEEYIYSVLCTSFALVASLLALDSPASYVTGAISITTNPSNLP